MKTQETPIAELQPNDLSHIFKNIHHKECNVPGYNLAFNVTENGRFAAELFYSKEFKEWFLIKDNYPAPRKAYRCSFPIKSKALIIELFKTVNIDLI